MNILLSSYRLSSKVNVTTLFFYAVFYINPFIDALTGYLVLSKTVSESFIGSPSQLFRFVVLGWALFYIRNLKNVNFCVLAAAYLFLIETVALILYGSFNAYIIGLVFSYKLVFAVVLYYAFKNLFVKKQLSASQLLTFFVNSGVIYSSILIGTELLGISFSSYALEGSKGLFASGNGLGFFLGVTFLMLIYKDIVIRKKFEYIKFFLILIALFLIRSKASVVFLMFGLILLFVHLPLRWKMITGIFTGLAILWFGSEILTFIDSAYQTIQFRYEHAVNFWEFFLSGRYGYIQNIQVQYNIHGILFYRLFIGIGYFLSYRNPFAFQDVPEYTNLIEMDGLDVFFMYGIVGVLAYTYLFIRGALLAYKNKSCHLLIAWMLIFFNSFFAGHVLFNGMSIIALIGVYAYMKFVYLEKTNIAKSIYNLYNEL